MGAAHHLLGEGKLRRASPAVEAAGAQQAGGDEQRAARGGGRVALAAGPLRARTLRGPERRRRGENGRKSPGFVDDFRVRWGQGALIPHPMLP